MCQVSVVIPLFNEEAEVERAIESVVAQTFREFEIVVVDDGSTDRGPEIVRQVGDPRIRMVRQENAGVSAARNRGIAEARADLIAFLDADDQWMPEFLETILGLRQTYPQCSVFATHYLFADGPGCFTRPILRGMPGDRWQGVLEDYFAVAAKSDCPLWTSAVSANKGALQSVDGFPVGVASGEDLLTWAKLALKYKIAYTTRPCSLFWRPRLASDTLPRHPEVPDVVGQQLRSLLEMVPASQKADFRKYQALWHKMRASKFIAFGERREALREIRNTIKANGITGKLALYACFGVLPRGLSTRTFNTAHRVLRALRNRWRRDVTEA
ncbi:glycosyltransferase family 2 protein [Planctomycetota bacterium]